LAEQLRDTDADLVYLDISAASLQVAKERAAIRGLTNITWVHGSLLDVAKVVEGEFDFIQCSGVLHHLESPETGLAALVSVLKGDGILGLMLYARYGREGVYQIQKLMRILNADELNMQAKVENCKAVLNVLPPTNGFQPLRNLINDVRQFGDIGIYDLFLHSNDVAYSIPETYAFLRTSGLTLTHLFFDSYTNMGNNLYRLEAYLKDDSLLQVIGTLSLEKKQAAAELMHGKILKHSFYASRQQPALPAIDDLDNVPFFSMIADWQSYQDIRNLLATYPVGQEARLKLNAAEIWFVKTPHTDAVFGTLDGEKSLGDIFREIRASYPATMKRPSIQDLKSEFAVIFAAFGRLDWILLRHKSVPRFKTKQELHSRMASL
jgi:hypothetical protein